MPIIKFEGKTTEEAIEKACNQLHIASDQLKFEIESTGSSGIFGLGSKKASIRVIVEEKISSKKTEAKPEEKTVFRKEVETQKEEKYEPVTYSPSRYEDFDDDDDEDDDDLDEVPYEPVVQAQPRPDRYHRESDRRDHDRRDYERRDYDRRNADRRETDRRDPDRRPQERPNERFNEEPILRDENHMPLPATVAAPGEDTYNGPEDEIMSKARVSLEGILSHMGLGAEVKVNRIEDRIILKVEGDNSGLLIGKKGATLDALQFLVNKIVNKNQTDKYRVIVDSENYRERRHQTLVELANRMAERARRTKRPVTISQLSAHDRRVVHLALQEKHGLRTRSRGEGPLKNIIIIPGNKKPGGRHPGGGRRENRGPKSGYNERRPEPVYYD